MTFMPTRLSAMFVNGSKYYLLKPLNAGQAKQKERASEPRIKG
jgi:hypothetical protein